MASWRSPGGCRAPGGPQVAAKAARKPTLGGSWALLGHFCWAVLGLLGPLLGSFWPPGRFLVEPFWVSFSGGFEKRRKPLIFDDGCSENQFLLPRGVQNRAKNGSKIALGHALAPLGLFWRLLARSGRPQKRPGRAKNGPDGQKTARPGFGPQRNLRSASHGRSKDRLSLQP